MDTIPAWMAELEEEDLTFIKKFILSSGSLKEVAALYGVSYPTVRLRLDKLIQKIRLTETAEADPYVSLVKRLAVDDKLDFGTAKLLISEYRRMRRTEETAEGAGERPPADAPRRPLPSPLYAASAGTRRSGASPCRNPACHPLPAASPGTHRGPPPPSPSGGSSGSVCPAAAEPWDS